MRNVLVISALVLGAVTVLCAQEQPPTPVVVAPSQSTPPPTPVRVATIFGQNAIVSTQEGQKASASLTAKYAPRRDEFNRKQAEMQSLRDQLKKGHATMSADVRDRLNQTIAAKNSELQRIGQDSQAALEEEEGAMRSEEHTSELQSLRHLVCRLLL